MKLACIRDGIVFEVATQADEVIELLEPAQPAVPAVIDPSTGNIEQPGVPEKPALYSTRPSTPDDFYHPDAGFVECDDSVTVGMTYTDGQFGPVPEPVYVQRVPAEEGT